MVKDGTMLQNSSIKSLKTRLLLNGTEKDLQSLLVNDQTFLLESGLLSFVRLEDEWHEDVKDPRGVVDALTREAPIGVDLFTFWQRPPRTTPSYEYRAEPEIVAALRVTDCDHWLSKQITPEARNRICKATRSGVMVTEATFDRDFIDGMVRIFNEFGLYVRGAASGIMVRMRRQSSGSFRICIARRFSALTAKMNSSASFFSEYPRNLQILVKSFR